MAVDEVTALDQSVVKTHEWLRQLAGELGEPEDLRYAFRVLRGFLHTLRNRLPVDEAAHLAAQLPELLRGVYYEGWRPSEAPEKYHDVATFHDHVAREARLAGETEAAYAAEAAARVLARHVTGGEMRKLRAVLPAAVAKVLPEPGER